MIFDILFSFLNVCDVWDARTIKKSSAYRRTRVKFGIFKLLMEAELEEQLAIDTHSAHIKSAALSLL